MYVCGVSGVVGMSYNETVKSTQTHVAEKILELIISLIVE